MWFVRLPRFCPEFFLIVAIIWSSFQAYAGYHYGVFISERAGLCRDKSVRFWAYGIHHGAIYFWCSVSGFAAWYLADRLSQEIKEIEHWSEVATGTGAILIALAVLSIVGVSGALPRILYLGNRPA
jgi:hypothetical protein